MKLSAFALISLASAAFAPTLAALDPAMLSLVSPSATALAGADVVRIQASPFGQFLMKSAGAQVGDVDKIAAATGFDIKRDLQEVLIATSSASVSGPSAAMHGLIIARGTFDQQRLMGMAKTAGLLSTGYKGVTLLTPQSGASPGFEAAAFLAGYFVAGGRAEVEGAIDRTSTRAASSGLAARALLASTKYDAWVVTTLASGLADAAGAQGVPLQGVNSLSAGVQFGTQVDIGMEAEARSPQDANSLADLLRLAAAFGQNNQGAPQIGNLLSTLSISAEGNIVKAGIKVPQADLEKMFNNNAPVAPRARRVVAVK